MASDPFDSNQLRDASSPYLRQHAGNPVHWQQWREATLARARQTDTPILLSIGYAACHWCHVMAHGCFENPTIAALMNASFINIKLDREERPDIDHVYQLAYQGLNNRGGGWPLTAFLDPQTLAPFYVGTYFPPTAAQGLPGFPEVLKGVRSYFDGHRGELQAQADELRAWLQRVQAASPSDLPTVEAAAHNALQRIRAHSDPDWGGSRGAPKFPRAIELEWLLDRVSVDHEGGDMAWLTLEKMAGRGLQDHLGGGFFRYCVDESWTIPHFEKMLYDNAQLLPVYARMASDERATNSRREIARRAVQGIVDWLMRDMRSPQGTFYSSLDADSEHEEGKFYLWTREQLRAALPAADVAFAERLYGFDQLPNFEGRTWHLLRTRSVDEAARAADLPTNEATARAEAIRKRLFEVREARVHPARDDKILTAWNAVTISGLARTARTLDDPRCADLALQALRGLQDAAWLDGVLYANVAAAPDRIEGFLDDYAFLLDALLEALQLRFDAELLGWALTLARDLVARFGGAAEGGFQFSANHHATPLTRSVRWQDDALPSGNGIAIRSLLRLGHLIGDVHLLDAAEKALQAGAGILRSYPEAALSLLIALEEYQQPRAQLVVRCGPAQAAAWERQIATWRQRQQAGGAAVDAFHIPTSAGDLPGVLSARTELDAAGTAYLCRGTVCDAPLRSPNALRAVSPSA
ncbi:MAG TPA: thioredoxin domain-containing protein [Nevskiaceae bacterium]